MPFNLNRYCSGDFPYGKFASVVGAQYRQVWGALFQKFSKWPITLPASAMANRTFLLKVLLGIGKRHAWSRYRHRRYRKNQFRQCVHLTLLSTNIRLLGSDASHANTPC